MVHSSSEPSGSVTGAVSCPVAKVLCHLVDVLVTKTKVVTAEVWLLLEKKRHRRKLLIWARIVCLSILRRQLLSLHHHPVSLRCVPGIGARGRGDGWG